VNSARTVPTFKQGNQAEAVFPILRIQPSRGWVGVGLADLWHYRELLYFLTWRDIKIRYKQTALGVLWALIQPALTMLIFSLFFGRLAKVPSDGIPYPLFTLAALVPWTLFSNGLSQSSNSLVGSANLIRKVYFPRLTIPIASILSGVVDFGFAFLLLVFMMYRYGFGISGRTLVLPFFLLLAVCTSLGVGLWLSALNVKYRDVRYVVPFVTQMWLFATPIAYPSSLLAHKWRVIYALNPMVGVVDGFRWALLGTSAPPMASLLVSIGVSLTALVSGVIYFRRMEKSFADIV
jgi:homopolymeric O-antigen transport system permease protein